MGRKCQKKKFKTKRMLKSLDLIFDDISSTQKQDSSINKNLDETKPGLGQFYCLECARYFINNSVLEEHRKKKAHKKRVKQLNQMPFTELESRACGGLDNMKFIKYKDNFYQSAQENLMIS